MGRCVEVNKCSYIAWFFSGKGQCFGLTGKRVFFLYFGFFLVKCVS
jgi:hypothetical protein